MKKPANSGFTLIELLVAIAILGVVMATVMGLFIRISARISQREARQEALERAEAAAGQIAARISTARGWISGDTLGILLLDAGLDTARLSWNADSGRVYCNASPLETGGRISRFRLQYLPRADTADAVPRQQWFEELDSDRNGTLEAGELKRASMALIEIRLRLGNQNMPAQKTARLPKPVIDPAELETE